MKATHFLLLGFCAAANATLLSSEDTLFASLLKRQEPGTPAYNCHDNCGTAITASKPPTPPPCTSPSFLTNYANCLQCSGPDNYNIWRYYGRSLAVAGAACGLETEPKSGVQGEVGPAVREGEGGSSGSTSVGGSATAASVSATESAASSTAAQTSAVASVVSSQSVSATASVTAPAPVEVSTNAAAGLGLNDAGIFGAIFVGALFGL